MKRSIFFIFLAGMLFLIASCVQPEIDSQIKLQPESGPAVFTATIDNAQTKVQLNEDGEGVHVLWSPADRITLFYGGGESGALFMSNNSEPSTTAEFTGTLPTAVEGNTDFNFYAVYPSHGPNNDKFDDGQIIPQLNQSQIYPNAGSFSYDVSALGSGAIFVGKSETHDIKFYNVCSFFRFKVTRNDVIRVDFEGKDEEEISGNFSVQFNATTGMPEVVVPEGKNSAGNKKGAINLRFTKEYTQCFEPGLWYYITLLPTTFQSGANVTIYTQTGKVTRSIAGPITFAQNRYRSIANIDTGVSFEDNYTDVVLTLNDSPVSTTTLWPHGKASLVPKVTAAFLEANGEYSYSVIPGINWSWSSNNSNSAKVSNKGMVTGVAAGTAEITATTTLNGTPYSLSCTVTVTEDPNSLDNDDAKPFVVDEQGTRVCFAPGNLYTSDGGMTFGFNTYQGQFRATKSWTNGIPNTRDLFLWTEVAVKEGDPIETPCTVPGYSAFTCLDWNNPKSFYIANQTWLPLSYRQWVYLLNNNGGFARATVNGVTGMILLPNSFDSHGVLITTGAETTFETNVYCGDVWLSLEQNGAVFLPEARDMTNTGSLQSGGHYWSRSLKNSTTGGGLQISSGNKVYGGTLPQNYYASVRPVRVVTTN